MVSKALAAVGGGQLLTITTSQDHSTLEIIDILLTDGQHAQVTINTVTHAIVQVQTRGPEH